MQKNLSRTTTYQQLGQMGMGNWFTDVINTVSDKVSDAALWASESFDSSYNWAQAKASQLTASNKKQLEDFQAAVQALMKTQKEVDEKLNALPEGPLKARLENKKKESRGYFTTYIMPAWESFVEWTGMGSAANFGHSQMGAVPFIGLAAVLGAVSVAMTWVYKSHQIEKEILNDPELAKIFVQERGKLGSFGIGKAAEYVAIGAVGIGAIYLFSLMRKD